jgi:protein SCO1
MTTRVRIALACWLAISALVSPSSASAGDEDPHAAHRRAMQAEVVAGETRVTLPNVTLRDAQNKPFAFRPESFRGKVVIVDFIFTTCTTICPALSSVMASVQRGLGEQMGKDVLLLSISVDPVNDTPPVMRAYAQRIGAGKDWLWLTGNTGDIARVLRAFGLSTGKPDDHPPLILVGDPAGNRWQRWVGVPTPAAVVERTREMVAQTGSAKTKSAGVSTAASNKDPHGHH